MKNKTARDKRLAEARRVISKMTPEQAAAEHAENKREVERREAENNLETEYCQFMCKLQDMLYMRSIGRVV